MAKIVLGNRPKNFKAKVTFPLLDGSDGLIEMSFRYRTRTEFGELIDTLMSDAGAAEQPEGQMSLAEALGKTRDTNAEYILKVADGWNLEEKFNLENVAQLCDEFPAAAMAIMNTYRAAITEGRLGN
jgi:hypothetical protein